MDAKEFGKFISQLRKEKQLTQAELGKKLRQRMEEADMKKEEVNAAVESTLDLMKYYEKMERRGKIWSLIMGGIGVLFLCVGIYIEMFMNNRYGMASMNAAIGVIGGADGPTSVFLAGNLGADFSIGMIVIGVILVAIMIILLRKSKK